MRNKVFDTELGEQPEDTEGNNAEINRDVTQDRWCLNTR